MFLKLLHWDGSRNQLVEHDLWERLLGEINR